MPLLVCWSEATSRSMGNSCKLRQQPRRPVIEFIDVGVLQCVLVLRARRATTDASRSCTDCKKQCRSGHLGQLRSQTRLMISIGTGTCAQLRGLRPIRTNPLFMRSVSAESRYRSWQRQDLWRPHRAGQVLTPAPFHRKRYPAAHRTARSMHAGVLLREEPLGDLDIECHTVIATVTKNVIETCVVR